VRRRGCLCTAIVLGLVVCASGAEPQPVRAGVPNAIRAAIDGPGVALKTPSRREHEQLTALYGPAAFTPLWTDSAGHPSRDARDALHLLLSAADDALDPADYDESTLEHLMSALHATAAPLAADIAGFDVGLSASTLRYLRELHTGRIDPRAIGFRINVPADDHDFAALLRSALHAHRVAEAAAELAPPLPLYRALRDVLGRYRSLVLDPSLAAPNPTATPIRPGQPYSGLNTLRRLLVAVGDLPPEVCARELSAYDDATADGVKRFQMRHGLAPDGVLGTSTQAALRVPLAWRVRQIELALERLRWLPHLGAERLVAVNIPMFHLWAWDSIPESGAPAFGMGVIVGRAVNTRTPVFAEEMRYLIFRPYWNVPASIARHEILPAIERDSDYLRRENMEIVAGQGDDARPVAVSPTTLEQLRQGRLRVRQRPGSKNALGLVKFVFPNDENVYLHGTPATQLFSRARRDFSHGCVRIEDPVALAAWAPEGQDEWTREKVLATMNGDDSRRVTLSRPIQVILFYITAVVMPDDGTIRFADDIYGHDRTLDRALVRRRAGE
jgi:L,D-transpeptidase YcbB